MRLNRTRVPPRSSSATCVRRPCEQIDQIVVGDHGVDRTVAVLTDVVDPVHRIALVLLRFHALRGGVPLQVAGDLLDVGEDGSACPQSSALWVSSLK